MSMLRWAVVAVIAGVASGSEAAPQKVAVATPKQEAQHEAEPRVELGPAVLYIFDENGKIIAVE